MGSSESTLSTDSSNNSSTTTDTSTTTDGGLFPSFDNFFNFDWVNNITWQTFFPPYEFKFPTGTVELLLLAVSAVGAIIVEVTANLSAFARLGYTEEEPNSYATSMLCLDALGEMLFGIFSIVQISLQYSYNTALFYWLLLMPPYAYQGFYGLWQTFNYCSLRDDTIILKRPDYGQLFDFDNFNLDAWITYFLSQMNPSRFNILYDFTAIGLAFYLNAWILNMWFIFATPINLGFEAYYYIDPLADMPPLFDFDLFSSEQTDVIG